MSIKDYALGSHSKQKGNSFERKIAKVFSEKFKHKYGGKDSFRRNLTSGGFFGGGNASRKESIIENHQVDIGDIMTPPNFKFTIECKFYKNAPTLASLFKGNKTLDAWIEQAKLQKDTAQKEFLLIVKWNGLQEMVILEPRVMLGYPLKNFISYKNLYIVAFEDILSIDALEFWYQ